MFSSQIIRKVNCHLVETTRILVTFSTVSQSRNCDDFQPLRNLLVCKIKIVS
jgi:hypothetical protein